MLHILMHEKPRQSPYAIAHRGAGGLAPENTLAGVQAALNHKATYIEVDVQRSNDGKLVVIHDTEVDRTTNGTGRVSDLSWEQLAGLDAGSHFASTFAGERIPTLDAVLESMAGRTVTLVVEAKDPELYPGIERQIAETLEQTPAQPVMVVSFNHDWLSRFHELAPHIPLGRISVWAYDVPLLSQNGVTSVFWLSVIVDPTLVRRIHRAGDQVTVWTVDQVWLMRLMLWMGVDGITTNRPDRWNQLVRTINSSQQSKNPIMSGLIRCNSPDRDGLRLAGR